MNSEESNDRIKAFGNLTKKLIKKRAENNWKQFRDVYLAMAHLLMQYEDTQAFITFSLVVCINDLTGLKDENIYNPLDASLDSDVVNELSLVIKESSISLKDVKEIIGRSYSSLDFPKTKFTKREMIDQIIFAIYNPIEE